MMKLRHLDGFPAYRADGRGESLALAWPAGEVREVSDVDAAYLLTEFSGRFAAIGAPVYRNTATVPTVTTSERGPASTPPDRSSGIDAGAVLSDLARDVVSAVEAGDYDAYLPALLEAENDRARPRKSVLRAIKGRADASEG